MPRHGALDNMTRLSRTLEFVRNHGFESAEILGPSRRCELARFCLKYGATTESIVLGCSFVQRLARVDSRLRDALETVTASTLKTEEVRVTLSKMKEDSDVRLFAIIYVISVGIATKIWGGKYSNFSRAVLEGLGTFVPDDIAYEVEAEILRRLHWRLQPIARVQDDAE